MDWLTAHKIPVGKWAAALFDWIEDNFQWLLDGLSEAMEALIDAILWLLLGPPPLVVIAAFTLLTWVLQRSRKTCVFVARGFLFILNQA